MESDLSKKSSEKDTSSEIKSETPQLNSIPARQDIPLGPLGFVPLPHNFIGPPMAIPPSHMPTILTVFPEDVERMKRKRLDEATEHREFIYVQRPLVPPPNLTPDNASMPGKSPYTGKRRGRPPKVRDPVSTNNGSSVPTMAQILPCVSSAIHSKDSVSVSVFFGPIK